eukprot:6191746-Pleurochrysis_carterae.AAC.5
MRRRVRAWSCCCALIATTQGARRHDAGSVFVEGFSLIAVHLAMSVNEHDYGLVVQRKRGQPSAYNMLDEHAISSVCRLRPTCLTRALVCRLLDWLVLAHAHARRADHLRRDDESRAEETRRQKLAQQMAQARCADSEAAAPGASGGETVLQGPRVQADGQGTANGADAAPTSSGPDQRGFCSADDVRVLREALADEPRAALDARWRSGDHYHVLGVPHDAAETELKRAYRQLSLRLHPDRPAGDERAFARVAAAFETLSDDKLRRAYHDGEAEDRKTSNNWRGDVDMPLREQESCHTRNAPFSAVALSYSLKEPTPVPPYICSCLPKYAPFGNAKKCPWLPLSADEIRGMDALT